MSIFMLSLKSSLHTISSLVHTAKNRGQTVGEKQWKIIKPSTKTVAVVTYKRWPFIRSYNNRALTRKILVLWTDGCLRGCCS